MAKLLTVLLLGLLPCSALHARTWDDEAANATQKNFAEYPNLLTIPEVAGNPADIQRNPAFLQRAFDKRGFSTKLLSNPANRPLVFAKLAGPPGAKTVLFYIHFDGQPVVPDEWAQPNPFAPVVKRRDAGGAWQAVERDALLAKPLDPELRVFARAASDDKAPILMMLTAVDLLNASGNKPAFDISVVLDSEEEIS